MTPSFPAAARAAGLEPREHIAGVWRTPGVALDAWNLDPNDGTRICRMRASSPAAIETALAAAADADADARWFGLPARARAEALRRVAARLEARHADLAHADALTTGVVRSTTELLAGIPPRAFAAAADLIESREAPVLMPGPFGPVEVLRLPRGPAVIVSPWNAPSPIAAHKLASALAAGCPVIFKPSEHAWASCQILGEAVVEAGLPAGTFQLVHGGADVGDALVRDPRVATVSFTGGVDAGRAVGRRSAEHIRPVQLELGGLNPLIVLDGADLAAAAAGIVAGLTTLNGQWCRALGRVLVDRRVADELFALAQARLGEVRIGHSLALDSQMGPIANVPQLERIARAVAGLAARGGQVHRPAALPALSGNFVAPTLITGLAAADAEEEIFGPVATWHIIDSAEEALAITRQSRHGLAAYVFGRPDEALAVGRRVHAGTVKLNAVSLLALNPAAPRAAWGLSGLGDEGTVETYEFFRGTRVVGAAAAAPPHAGA